MWKMGQSQTRIEDDSLLRGRGSFTADRVPRDAIFMAVLRSPVAAGRLTAIDTGPARSIPGVVEVLTAAEQEADGLGAFRMRVRHPGPEGGPMREPHVLPLATDLLQYVGHPVAIALAESPAAAEDAIEALEIDIEDRDPVTDPERSIAPGAPLVWPDQPDNRAWRVNRGDREAVKTALEGAVHLTRARLRISRVTAAALEPRAVVATYQPESGYRLDTGTQAPHRLAADLAPVLGTEPDRIRVVSRDTGGSFGMKNAGYPEYALALWAARRLGRPVAWQATRTESFLSDAHARDQVADAALALDGDGRIVGLDVAITAGIGACPGPATSHPPSANVAGLAGVYRVPAIHVSVDAVFTNCQQVAPYRGAGRPEATYIIERMLDLTAGELGLGRAEIRRRNLIPAHALPWTNPLGWIYDSGDFEGVLDRALAASDWQGFEARRKDSAAHGKLRGIGIANPIEIAGGPPAGTDADTGPVHPPLPEYARLSVAAQGNARAELGICGAGQGHDTAFRQILCDRLGLDPAAVEIVTGDTGRVPRGTGTFGSRSLAAGGTALWSAMDDAIEAVRPLAASLLKVEPGALDFAEGRFVAPDGGAVSWLEAVAQGGAAVEAEAFVSAHAATFPNGCHVCEVEVDPETGATQIVGYTVVDDVGTVLNPLLLKGQIAGGIAQGIGQALAEEVVYDPETGEVLSASFMDYAIPRAVDLPAFSILSHPVPTRANPLGAKGAGEAGTVGALAATISAVSHALSVVGIGHIDMPASPSRIWSALHDKGR